MFPNIDFKNKTKNLLPMKVSYTPHPPFQKF